MQTRDFELESIVIVITSTVRLQKMKSYASFTGEVFETPRTVRHVANK